MLIQSKLMLGKAALFAALVGIAPGISAASSSLNSNAVSGSYLEARSCDVYTGPCFANGEMGLAGKEGILVWSISEGNWNGISMDGLNVIAVVATDSTLGDQWLHPRQGAAAIIVDERANPAQRQALQDFVRTASNGLIAQVAKVSTAAMDVSIGNCSKSGCASIRAGDLVEISTRCIGGEDHLCGNEETYYPPLTAVQGATPAVAELAAFRGESLNRTWEQRGQRSAFLATFSIEGSNELRLAKIAR